MPTTDSDPVTVIAPSFIGVYIHDPVDPAGTLTSFLYSSSLSVENFVADANLLQFAGREFPVAEFGENSNHTVDLSITIPFDDDWQALVLTAQGYASFRDTLTFRDGRGRVIYGVVQSVRTTDRDEGSVITFTVTRVDYTPQPFDLTTFVAEDA
jgi:hypothetical protein